MSRGIFYSHNKVGETMSFKTNSPNTTTFDPVVGFVSGSARVSWDLGNNSGYTAGNSISYMYPDATTKTVTIRTNLLKNLQEINLKNDNIVGHLNMSGWDNLGGDFRVDDNTELTGITHTSSSQVFTQYYTHDGGLDGTLDLSMLTGLGGRFENYNNTNLTQVIHTASTVPFTTYFLYSCGLTGTHDMSMLPGLGGSFLIWGNSALTGITHTTSTENFTYYRAYECDLTGNHNVPFSNLGGEFNIRDNDNLTSITHIPSPQIFTTYNAHNCNLTGTHDLSMFPNLGGYFAIQNNTSLTSITHTPSPQIFTTYNAPNCNLTGNHDMSMFPNLGGVFSVFTNTSLTSITHTASTQSFSSYQAYDCNLTGNHDMSMLTGFGGRFAINDNSNLESITHAPSTEVFIYYRAYDCNLGGVPLDVSPLSALAGDFQVYLNSALVDIVFPYTVQSFANFGAAPSQRAFALHDCNLGYIDFLPLSGATLDVNSLNGASIGLEDNGMSAAEVNLTLFDFYELNNTYSQPGWSGVTLDISGSNAAPDATSGGVDGLTSQTILVNDYGWTITSN